MKRVSFVFRQVHSRVTRGFFIVALGTFGKKDSLPLGFVAVAWRKKTRVRLPRVSPRDTPVVHRRFAVGATCTKFAFLLRQCRLRRYYCHNETHPLNTPLPSRLSQTHTRLYSCIHQPRYLARARFFNFTWFIDSAFLGFRLTFISQILCWFREF